MLETKDKVIKKKRLDGSYSTVHSKETIYKEPVRKNRTAEKKEEIVSKYPESLQLNLLRKAVLGDSEAIKALQDMENDIGGLK